MSYSRRSANPRRASAAARPPCRTPPACHSESPRSADDPPLSNCAPSAAPSPGDHSTPPPPADQSPPGAVTHKCEHRSSPSIRSLSWFLRHAAWRRWPRHHNSSLRFQPLQKSCRRYDLNACIAGIDPILVETAQAPTVTLLIREAVVEILVSATERSLQWAS